MDLRLVRAGIAAGLNDLAAFGLNTYPHLSGAGALPFACLGNLEGIAFDANYRGRAEFVFPLWVVVSRANEAAAVAALDRACSIDVDGSVFSAIRALSAVEGDHPWRSISCVSAGAYGTFTFGTTAALATAFALTIKA